LHLVNSLIIGFIAFLLILSGPSAHGTDKNAFDFDLKNFDGERVTTRALRGKVVLLTFSYAYCSVRCPLITARLSSLDDRLNAPKDVVYLHVSVDPEMDTPERRVKYFNLYGIDAVKDNRWMFVSGQKDELVKLWRFYGIEIEKMEEKRIPEGYYMEYTPKIVIISKGGTIAYEVDFHFMEEEMARKMGGII
jgi:protein SCO1/2